MARNDTVQLERPLTLQELAARYDVTPWTVYRWNSTGTGPKFMKIGRHCRYKLADVLAWEATRYADGAPR